MGEQYPYSDETYRIIGACFEVYNEKGCGLLEPVYQECLAIEFEMQEIPFTAQREILLDYKGRELRSTYRPDFVCFNEVIVEIKATSAICDGHRAQMVNYLKATGMEVGLLVNFGHHPKLEYERFVNSQGSEHEPQMVRMDPPRIGSSPQPTRLDQRPSA